MIQDKTPAYRVFQVFNAVFMILIIIATAYPMYYVVVASVSDPHALMRTSDVLIAPLRPYTLDAYRRILQNPMIGQGYLNTAFIIIVGVTINIILTCMAAYFLSLRNIRFGTAIMFLIVVTRYISGGMIPSYLNVRDLHLLDSTWALILPVAINTYNMIIMRTAFASVPHSLVESAQLDGARHFTILYRVMVPLAKPTIAVLVLYYGVSHWNSWFSASIYLRTRAKWPLQLVMREILLSTEQSAAVGGADLDSLAELSDLVKYALIVIGTAPILCLYPFLQKYFVKGVMIGALKG